MIQHTFEAMGTRIEAWCADRAAVDDLEGWFELVEGICSRFRPESELSRINASPLPEVTVSPLLQGVLKEATWAREATEGLVDVGRSIEVGLRGPIYEAADWTGLRTELGLEYLTTEEVLERGPEEVARVIRERVGEGPAFVSFDIDVVDPAFAPGTGTPEPGGLSAHDALAMLLKKLGQLALVGGHEL